VEDEADETEGADERPVGDTHGDEVVAREAEHESQIEWDGGDEPEPGKVVRVPMQPVLEQEGDWHVEQATIRVVQRNQQDQGAMREFG